MRPRMISMAIALTSVSLLGVLQVGSARAGDRSAGRVCSNATLKGSYGFYRTGTTPIGPLAAVGLISFDGKGNQTGSQNTSRNGMFSGFSPFASEYEVAEDCTAKLIDPTTGNEFALFVIVDNGKELYGLSLTPGNAVYGVYRKM